MSFYEFQLKVADIPVPSPSPDQASETDLRLTWRDHCSVFRASVSGSSFEDVAPQESAYAVPYAANPVLSQASQAGSRYWDRSMTERWADKLETLAIQLRRLDAVPDYIMELVADLDDAVVEALDFPTLPPVTTKAKSLSNATYDISERDDERTQAGFQSVWQDRTSGQTPENCRSTSYLTGPFSVPIPMVAIPALQPGLGACAVQPSPGVLATEAPGLQPIFPPVRWPYPPSTWVVHYPVPVSSHILSQPEYSQV